MIPLTRVTGGGIWIEDPEGTAQCPNLDCNLPGKILELPQASSLQRSTALFHGPSPWEQVVLVAFSPRGLEKLTCHDLRLLRSLGFKLPRSLGAELYFVSPNV